MAVSSAQVTVGTTATLLTAVEADTQAGSTLVITNASAVAVFIGPATVTTTTGLSLAAGATLPRFELNAGESVYGVVATGTAAVHVLRTGV